MTADPQAAQDFVDGGDPIGPGFFEGLSRVWATKLGRRTLILVVGVVFVVVVIGAGLVIFSGMSRETQSYKDGFSVGGAVYASDSVIQEGAQQACAGTERLGPKGGGRPSVDNATQWLKGCVAAFNAAQEGN